MRSPRNSLVCLLFWNPYFLKKKVISNSRAFYIGFIPQNSINKNVNIINNNLNILQNMSYSKSSQQKRQAPSRFSPKLASSFNPNFDSQRIGNQTNNNPNSTPKKNENTSSNSSIDDQNLVKQIKAYNKLQNEQMEEAHQEMIQGLETYDRKEKEFTNWTKRLSRKYWIYGTVFGVLGIFTMFFIIENKKKKRSHTSNFYLPIEFDSNMNDIRIGRTTFLIEGRIGLSSNSYIAKIDKENLFIYNNISFIEEMKQWSGPDLKNIYMLVPNRFHNYLLKNMVKKLNDYYPNSNLIIFVREGISKEKALKSWNEAPIDIRICCKTNSEVKSEITMQNLENINETSNNIENECIFRTFNDESDFPSIIRDRFTIFPTQGLPDLDETVIYDKKHGILVFGDLLSNVRENTFPTNKLNFSTLYLYYKIKGFTNRFTPLPPKTYQELENNIDREKFVESLNTLTFFPNVRGIVMAHGEPILPSTESIKLSSNALLQWRASWQERSKLFKIEE